ncbi:BadF/BadG/BcrA/BcrD ATPase family protein [Duganella sp.]|uniref:N-acetylglucosamine kinase n=1 Tax=Duganella sp. TaxID=1904440 RepID=UPI0031DEBD2B
MSHLGLGIDAGGTQTRWALADAAGAIVAEGSVAGMSATQMASTAGRDAVRGIFAMLATQVLAAGQPVRVCAGLTGFDGVSTQATQMLAEALKLAPSAVGMRNDVEIAYLDSFAPGEGYLVYAGTGSIAAFIDADGQFHRAGGRGVTLDDGGGGFWIAREAMRHIWRLEDEQPGVWQQSAMARAVFAQIGGSDWSLSRQFIYGQDRGAIGRLALAVAASADTDPVARNILERAGSELARIALALVGRYGARPIALGGRAAHLHPLIAQSMRAALPAELSMAQRHTLAHHAAARIALHSHH